MGEEKPDEELMGKRKPAPRLSTTFCDVDNYMMSLNAQTYTREAGNNLLAFILTQTDIFLFR